MVRAMRLCFCKHTFEKYWAGTRCVFKICFKIVVLEYFMCREELYTSVIYEISKVPDGLVGLYCIDKIVQVFVHFLSILNVASLTFILNTKTYMNAGCEYLRTRCLLPLKDMRL